MSPSPSPKPSIPPNDNVAHALAGAGGGILSMVLTYPLITLSTRAQVESRRADSTFLAAVRSIVAREGISGLYSGLKSALLGIGVTNFVYYYWFEWTRAFFEKAAVKAGRAGRKLTTIETMIAGAIAGSATVIVTNPIWVVNTRMTTRRQHGSRARQDAAEKAQEGEAVVVGDEEKGAVANGQQQQPKAPAELPDTDKKVGTIGTLHALLKHEGPQALFAGVLPALVLVINPILQYTLFEQLKNVVEKKRKMTPAMAFFLGALGKLFATTITYPYITIKSQMHVAGNSQGQKEGMVAAIRRVIREEGYAGLYKGLPPKVTQSVLTAALLFAFKDVLYEKTVQMRMAAAARKRVS